MDKLDKTINMRLWCASLLLSLAWPGVRCPVFFLVAKVKMNIFFLHTYSTGSVRHDAIFLSLSLSVSTVIIKDFFGGTHEKGQRDELDERRRTRRRLVGTAADVVGAPVEPRARRQVARVRLRPEVMLAHVDEARSRNAARRVGHLLNVLLHLVAILSCSVRFVEE